MTRLAEDITRRARLALADDGHPNPAWSTGEQLFVALVLDDTEHLDAERYTREEAIQRLAGEIYGDTDDAEAWIRAVRAGLADDLLRAWRASAEHPVSEDARRLDAIRSRLAAFDWEHDDRQLALEAIERIVDAEGGR